MGFWVGKNGKRVSLYLFGRRSTGIVSGRVGRGSLRWGIKPGKTGNKFPRKITTTLLSWRLRKEQAANARDGGPL